MIEILIGRNKAIVEMFRWTRGNEQAHWVGFGDGTYMVTLPAEDAVIFKLRFNV